MNFPPSPYIPHTEKDILEMCKAIGVGSIEELVSVIPKRLRLKEKLKIPEGMSEQALKALLEGIGKKNSTVKDFASFLGAGAYNHYIPAVVDYISSRGEFLTAYTPYQPEASQGTLQAIFEYQTLICQLTGMEISNASLYDGAAATAEAVLMARRISKRKKVLLSSALHPEYRDTVRTYLSGQDEAPKEVLYCTEKGQTLAEAVLGAIDETTACLVVQTPNFFGSIEDIPKLSQIVHAQSALLIAVVTEPLSLALLMPPGSLGADIVVGEGQSFGSPLNFGGPYLGFMATKLDYIRYMPGRIVGQSVDKNNNRAFALAFATREQHIRRENATSNICTNEGLSALSAAVYLTALGKNGLRDLALTNLSNASFLKEKLSAIRGIKPAFSAPTFNEFTIEVDSDCDGFLKALLKENIIAGFSLKRFYPTLKRHILIAATEENSRQEMERFLAAAKKALHKK